MATDNKSLGKFILDGIPPAPRGVPQIEVTFDIDANGIIKVTALDKATSRSQHITITASSGLSDSEVERMRSDAEAHAEEDRQRKEMIEARNAADASVYTAEKALRDFGEKVPGEVRGKVEAEVATVRRAMEGEDLDALRRATESLNQVVQQIGAAAYQSAGPEAGPAGGEPGEGQADSGPGPEGGEDGEDVVEGEFHNV